MAKYLDLNTSFRIANGESNIIVEDIKAICKDLERLFNTSKGTIPFNRGYGSSVKQ